jgi:hypothetical protein
MVGPLPAAIPLYRTIQETFPSRDAHYILIFVHFPFRPALVHLQGPY